MLIKSFHRLNIFILVASINVKVSIANQFTHDRKRVGPADVAMAEHGCLQKFTVSENTIIRTQDSRLLGAKFLNESDIGNREDCLTFCCNTRYCDVAVFQEKSPFSCYLFDCGPPENFLCKFTGHSFYTSAVLAINRHQMDLGVWSSQFQHEAELTDLRFTSDNRKPSNSPSVNDREQSSVVEIKAEPEVSAKATAVSVTTTTTDAATNPSPNPLTTKSFSQSEKANSRKCSNFQFECHSGECIAIYNACDGIPQCADGSDEGKQLACPQGESSGSITNESESVKSDGRSHTDQNWSGQSGQQPSARRKFGPERGIFNHRSNLLEYNHYPNDVSPDYAREESLGYGGHGKGPGYYDYPQRQPSVSKYNIGHQDGLKGEPSPVYHHDYPDYSLINRQHEIQQISNQRPRQQIFPAQNSAPIPGQHRSGGSMQTYRQSDDNSGQHWQGPNPQYTPYQAVPQNMPRIQHYEDTLHEGPQIRYDPGLEVPQPVVIGRNENLQLEPINYNQMPRNFKQENLHEVPNNPSISPPRPQEVQHLEENTKEEATSVANNDSNSKPNNALNDKTKESSKTLSSDEKATTNTSQLASATAAPEIVSKNDDKTSKVDETRTKAKAVATKAESSQPVHVSLSRLTVNVEELEREEESQKVQTSGAILALSLGMSVTILLIVLVGCRIRKVKRRARRRRGLRSPLEHDVDYLVNGMYL